MDPSRLACYAALPKVELHLHLEGAIPLPALWELIQAHGGDPEVPDINALRRRGHRLSLRDPEPVKPVKPVKP